MKAFVWDDTKNKKLKAERGVSFEEVVTAIEQGSLIEVIENHNQDRYRHQQVFIVEIKQYAHLVPFVESEQEVLLITIIRSRKATRKYLGKGYVKN
ncbi:MAG: BrnT family toxin [Candidatus Marinimicrobia bacterium]|nr:BrnT family toxin [Candidatus Neomarinimicrobiota bacterium]